MYKLLPGLTGLKVRNEVAGEVAGDGGGGGGRPMVGLVGMISWNPAR